MAVSVRKDLDLEAGAPFAMRIQYLLPPDNVGHRAPGIPAGYVATAQFRAHPNQATALLELHPSIDYVAGEFLLTLTSAQTRSLPSLGSWACEVADPSGEPSIPLTHGRVDVSAEGVR